MDLFNWEDNFSVSSPVMDEHHKKLFNIINRLHETMKSGHDHLEEKIKEAITELLEYTIYHFKEEERLMQEANYPEFEAHKQAHNDFCQAMSDLKKRADNGQAIFLAGEIKKVASEWLVHHILNVDKRYAGYIA